VLLAACSGGGGDGDVAAFCDTAEQLSENATSVEPSELADDAPPEIRREVQTQISAQEAIAELEEDDESAAVDIATDPDVLAAGRRIEQYLAEECGVGTTSTSEAADDTTTTEAINTDPSVTEDSTLQDEGSVDADFDIAVLGVPRADLDTYLADEFSLANLIRAVNTFGSSEAAEVELYLELGEGDGQVAVDACQELSNHLAEIGTGDGTATVTINRLSEDNDYVVVARNDALAVGAPGTCALL
jgi:hypothetical protein